MTRNYRIAVIAGDGIGPEVTREGLRVLDALAAQAGFRYEATHYPYGSEHFLATGELMPDSIWDELRAHHAVLVGAIGDPRVEVGKVEFAVIGGLRFKLDLFANVRPIRLLAERVCPLKNKGPQDVDILVIRENTEDAYAGVGGHLKKGTPDEVAVQEMIYTRRGVERVIRYAYERCRKRNKRKKLTLVDKANAIRAQEIWTRVFAEVGKEFPDVEQDHAYIDAACMWLVKSPDAFDTMVTTNLFGDILTDLGAMIQGGMGIAASGNIHPGRVSMFEPIHGSAPKYKGTNTACPLAAISAVQMMLEHVGELHAAAWIEASIQSLVERGAITSYDAKSGIGTRQTGDLVLSELARIAK